MVFIILFSFVLLFSTFYSNDEIQWNTEEIEITEKPIVRKFTSSWERHVMLLRLHHHKTHFGIIIKKGTEFTLSIDSSRAIESLFFYCLSESEYGTFNMLELTGETNSKKTVTANFDCVPVISVSYNVPVEITIKTKNWITLPIFDTKNISSLTSQQAEWDFFQKVKLYGFVENHHTQMLLSLNDIYGLIVSGNDLFTGLQNQADIIKYYNYLTGASKYVNENDSLSYALVEKATIFIRTEPCPKNCNYQAYFSTNWIACPEGILDFLNPVRGSSWIILHEIAHYYDINSVVSGFGSTVDVWTNIFASFYQQKFSVDEYWIKGTEEEELDTISKYKEGVPFKDWDYKPKLHLFMSLFGYDGTDKSFREFNIRYFSDPSSGKDTNNVIPTLLEVFLDLCDINLLPFLGRIIDFKNYSIPLLSPDLELRLMSTYAVMPAIDFKMKESDLRIVSEERVLRGISPLTLLRKVKKMYVNVKFTIQSPVELRDHCLYLNNDCHTIDGHEMNLKLLADVYSIYVAENIDNLYVSEVQYHTIAEDKEITIEVKEEKGTFLPLIHYTIEARGFDDELFLQVFINYKDMTIGIEQITDQVHHHFGNEIYCSVTLERNEVSVFEYEVYGLPKQKKGLINVVHKFEINDVIYIFHREPNRLRLGFMDSLNELIYNGFVLTNTGLRNTQDESGSEITEIDIKRIDKFSKDYYVDLSYNPLYKVYLDRYTHALIDNGLEHYVPKEWTLSKI